MKSLQNIISRNGGVKTTANQVKKVRRNYENPARAYYTKKSAKTNSMVAHTALARAAYFVMRDQVPFDPARVFA
jgi:transposase